jgi:DNA invertase Pin-like site-specific DNA recombinase
LIYWAIMRKRRPGTFRLAPSFPGGRASAHAVSRFPRRDPFGGDGGALDTSTAAGKMMFHVMGAFAEVERSIIRERVNAGVARAKAEQKAGIKRVDRDGRARKLIGRPRLDPKIAVAVRRLRGEGMSIEKIADAQGIEVGSVARILKAPKPDIAAESAAR